MTPEEARQISQQNGRINHLIVQLYDRIQSAAEEGEYCCFLHEQAWRYSSERNDALKVIEDQGFHVDRNYDNKGDYLGNDTIVCISWRV